MTKREKKEALEEIERFLRHAGSCEEYNDLLERERQILRTPAESEKAPKKRYDTFGRAFILVASVFLGYACHRISADERSYDEIRKGSQAWREELDGAR